MATIAVIGTLDTKGPEFAYLKDQIESRGHRTLVIDVGVLDPPHFRPDVTRQEVAAAAGAEVQELIAANDRGRAVSALTDGLRVLIRRLLEEARFDAVIGMGGSAGTTLATAAMRELPLGLPKVMVSTLAGKDVSAFVDVKDIVMIPSIVDLSGLNRISRRVIAGSAAAVCAMAETGVAGGEDKPILCASMFGNTTRLIDLARPVLEGAGYEVLVFHATGTGGRSMESLIEAGLVEGVLDVTTTEWADELVGGVLTAGPHRLEASARAGIPAVIAPGCLDMVNFWAPETVPEGFRKRRLYRHNPNVTLMRTDPNENRRLGEILAEKINASVGPVAVYLPLRGLSVIGAPGGPFHWPKADQALFEAVKAGLRPDIPVHEIDAAINDEFFARAVAQGLLDLIGTHRSVA